MGILTYLLWLSGGVDDQAYIKHLAQRCDVRFKFNRYNWTPTDAKRVLQTRWVLSWLTPQLCSGSSSPGRAGPLPCFLSFMPASVPDSTDGMGPIIMPLVKRMHPFEFSLVQVFLFWNSAFLYYFITFVWTSHYSKPFFFSERIILYLCFVHSHIFFILGSH